MVGVVVILKAVVRLVAEECAQLQVSIHITVLFFVVGVLMIIVIAVLILLVVRVGMAIPQLLCISNGRIIIEVRVLVVFVMVVLGGVECTGNSISGRNGNGYPTACLY